MNRVQLSVSRRRSGGFTLIELLVTITIILLITAAAIPVVLPALAGRRVREAGRSVSVMLDAARARAMELGRPCGVMIERRATQPHWGTSMSHCEVPEPYSGESTSARVTVTPVREGTTLSYLTVSPLQPDSGWPDFSSSAFADVQTSYKALQASLVQPGDQIELGGRGERFQLEFEYRSGGASFFYISATRRLDIDVDGASIDHSAPLDPEDVVVWQVFGRTQRDLPIAPGDYSYRVHRQPVKSAMPAVELPQSSLIDLIASGAGATIRWGDRQDHDTFFPLFYSTTPVFSPNNGFGVDRSWFDETTEEIGKPLVILFGPTGALDRIGHYGEVAYETFGQPRTRNVYEYHDAPVFLLVAKRDGVPTEADLKFSGDWPRRLRLESWRDSESMWVIVNSRDGRVSVQQNNAPPDPLLSTFSLTATPAQTVERLYTGLNYARRAALDQSIGEGTD